MDGGRVVAVDEQGWDAVADALGGDRRRGGLLGQRHADRVAVVLDEEHHGRLPDRREVERLVRVALARRAVAEHDQRGLVRAPQRGGVGEPHRVQRVRRQRRALRRHVVQVRVVAAVPVAAQQGEGLARVHAAGDDRHAIAVCREQPVLVAQREHGPDLAGVLAARGRVHREAALPGQRRGLGVEAAAEHHAAVQLAKDLGTGKLKAPVIAARMPVRVDQLQRRHAREQARRLGVVKERHDASLLPDSFPIMRALIAVFPGGSRKRRIMSGMQRIG